MNIYERIIVILIGLIITSFTVINSNRIDKLERTQSCCSKEKESFFVTIITKQIKEDIKIKSTLGNLEEGTVSFTGNYSMTKDNYGNHIATVNISGISN